MREHKDGDFGHGAEFTAIARDLMGFDTFVADGLEASKSATAFEIQITAGTVFVNGVELNINTSQTVTLSSESTLTRRYDLLTVDETGAVNVTEGVDESTAPDIPADECVLAVVKVDKDAVDVASEDIKDARILTSVRNNHHPTGLYLNEPSAEVNPENGLIYLASGNAIAVTKSDAKTFQIAVDESAISHDSIGGVSDDDHHDGFVGLETDDGTVVSPKADDRIRINEGNAIGVTKNGSDNLEIAVNESDISHGSISNTGTIRHRRTACQLSGNERDVAKNTWLRVAGFRALTNNLYLLSVCVADLDDPDNPSANDIKIRVQINGTTRRTDSNSYYNVGSALADLSSYVSVGDDVTIDIYNGTSSVRSLCWGISFALNSPQDANW